MYISKDPDKVRWQANMTIEVDGHKVTLMAEGDSAEDAKRRLEQCIDHYGFGVE